MELILENVRCFAGKHIIPIKPLTVLLGENSSGKTTFLAMLAAATNARFPAPGRCFSIAPYDLGGFDTIATYRGGRGGRAHHFSIGYRDEVIAEIIEVNATFGEKFGQPVLTDINVYSDRKLVSIKLQNQRFSVEITPKINGNEDKRVEPTWEGDIPESTEFSLLDLLLDLEDELDRSEQRPKPRRDIMGMFFVSIDLFLRDRSINSVKSIAPIRTKPKRTYDTLTDDYQPEGDHVPLLLAKALASLEKKKDNRLYDALKQFGVESGMYKEINIRRLGNKPGDPFQITVKVAGPATNLQDVGYGVSQSLPVVVESVLTSSERRLLLQQPEVHLHPRAQAALASFICQLVASESKQFVIETHSDYIVDRIRQEVAAGNLSPESVQLLFFDKKGLETKIYTIDIDKNGNVVNAPPSYRLFFLQEELNLISRTEKRVSDH